ncbi:MAG: hypothetical protein OEZ59_00015 [Deltaproteobacteria bacterium]|nr:hypothetical protein [Deltaproteobacteria bacterium]
MSLNVSSWFIEHLKGRSLSPLRRFTLGGSDYSDKVLRWPSLNFRADTIDLGTTQVELDATGNHFQFLVNCNHLFSTSAEISLGLTHPQSGPEFLNLYLGGISNIHFERGGTRIRLQMQGKTKDLTDTALGSEAESLGLDFTSSMHFPSDFVWMLVTSYGGMSALESTSNPDIDYETWLKWRQDNILKDTRVKAYLTGEKIYQIINTLAEMDTRVVAFQGGRLFFSDMFQPYSEGGIHFDLSRTLDFNWELGPSRIINEFTAEAGYNPSTGKFNSNYTKTDDVSQSNFGIRSRRHGSKGVWFARSFDGIFMAQDKVYIHRNPLARMSIRTTLGDGLLYNLGEILSITDSHLGLDGKNFRLIGQGIDLDSGITHLQLEEAAHRQWEHRHMVSSYNLTVDTITRTTSGKYLAIEELVFFHQLHKSDGNDNFSPTGLYAQRLLDLGGGSFVFAGAPSSGSYSRVIQRSSDNCETSTMVFSGIPQSSNMRDLFRCSSSHVLLSADSGQVYLSTDIGSSWVLTDVISPGTHIGKFFHPYPDRIFGISGGQTYGLEGLHIWESNNLGVSFSYKTTIFSSGVYTICGVHVLSGSEFLIGHNGLDHTHLGITRVSMNSSEDMSWATVKTNASFSHILRTTSGTLVMGYYEYLTSAGGSILMSTDNGSSWQEYSRVAMQGNIHLMPQPDGSLDAVISRTSAGIRTDRHKCFDPGFAFPAS